MKKLALAAVVLSLGLCASAQTAQQVDKTLATKKATADLASVKFAGVGQANPSNKQAEAFNNKLIANVKLIEAATIGNKEAFDAALKLGADINTTIDGNSIVMILTVNNHYDLLKYAVNVKGANINIANKKNVKPVQAAKALKYGKIYAFLVETVKSTGNSEKIDMLEALQMSLH